VFEIYKMFTENSSEYARHYSTLGTVSSLRFDMYQWRGQICKLSSVHIIGVDGKLELPYIEIIEIKRYTVL